MEGTKIWNHILSGVKSQVSHSTFKTWFSGAYVLDFRQDAEKPTLIIALKNNFLKEQVETRYSPIIKKIASQNGTRGPEVIFVVAPKVETRKATTEPIFSGVPQSYLGQNAKAEILNPDYNFDNFVVGPSNNLAYTAARQAGLGSVTYNPLLIYGATGVGKTHILQAIGNQHLATFADTKVIYASSEKFTNDYIESLKNKTQESFRRKYRTVDLLLIDDVQFLAGKDGTQDEFFYTFNELNLANKQIVLVSDKHPSQLGKIKERLASRFLGGLCVDIGLPDVETRKAIIEVKCKNRGVSLPSEITEYIAQVCPGGARELEGFLISALSLSKLSGGKITLDEIKASLPNSQRTSINVGPEEIAKAVSSHFKISQEDLCGPSRKANLVLARQVLIYLLRKDLGLSLIRIGVIAGNRDHSTVINSLEKFNNLLTTSQNLRDEIARIRSAYQQ